MRTTPALTMTIGNYLHKAVTKLRFLPGLSFSLKSGLSWLLEKIHVWNMVIHNTTNVHRSCRVLKGLLIELS